MRHICIWNGPIHFPAAVKEHERRTMNIILKLLKEDKKVLQ